MTKARVIPAKTYGHFYFLDDYWPEHAGQVMEIFSRSPKLGGVAIFERGREAPFRIVWSKKFQITELLCGYEKPRGRVTKIEELDPLEAVYFLREAAEREDIYVKGRRSSMLLKYFFEIAFNRATQSILPFGNCRYDFVLAASIKHRLVLLRLPFWPTELSILAVNRRWLFIKRFCGYYEKRDFGGLLPVSYVMERAGDVVEMLRDDKSRASVVLSCMAYGKEVEDLSRRLDPSELS